MPMYSVPLTMAWSLAPRKWVMPADSAISDSPESYIEMPKSSTS